MIVVVLLELERGGMTDKTDSTSNTENTRADISIGVVERQSS